jgi:F420-dependent oxidoreductase-like protein
MLALWRRAEAAGYDSLWNFDHFYPVYAHPDGPCLESWTTLSALALATTRVRIGPLVSPTSLRHPCITAKMAATVDHISSGRMTLGLGAGWYEREHTTFGIGFKTPRERLAALEESCAIIKAMFTQPQTTFHGRHYRVAGAMCLPKPIQRPHPPILVAGTGKRVLLRIVAKFADVWNARGSPGTIRDLVTALHRHADAVGRDPATIEKSVLLPLAYDAGREREDFVSRLVAAMDWTSAEEARQRMLIGRRQQCLDTIERYIRTGVTHFILMLVMPHIEDEIVSFAEDVIAAVRGSTSAPVPRPG